mgnify:CR=1 FL=1
MDARNTGALIAARRKALGLTQKQLAERLLVSDKAVSKWEVGASYPEVTLLPPLAQILGLTVDELLAGEVRGEPEQEQTAAPEDTPPEDGDRRHGKAAAFSPEAFLPPQDYLADRLGSTDDKLLLAVVVLILATAYCGNPYRALTALRNLVIILVIYIAFCVWHSKQLGRFAALGVDTTVNSRRARMSNRMFGSVMLSVVALALLSYMANLWIGREVVKIDRYHVVLNAIDVHVTGEAVWFGGWYAFASVPLCLALVGLFALAYRRMTMETRFRPLAVVLPVLPCLVGAGVVAWQRVQTALANMPDYGEALTPYSKQYAFKQMIVDAGQRMCIGVGIVVAVLVVALLVLWRVKRRVPLVSAIMLAVYALIWLPSGALWLDIGYENFINVGGTEDITIQLFGLIILLALTALSAGIALFADSLRRKKA